MNRKYDVNQDTVDQIHDLAGEGLGRKRIADAIDMGESVVKAVLEGKRQTISNNLNTRQRQTLIMQAFRP